MLIEEGFAIRGPPHDVVIYMENGTAPLRDCYRRSRHKSKRTKIVFQSTVWMKPGMHKRLINADETDVGGNERHTGRTAFIAHEDLPQVIGKKNKNGPGAHLTANLAMIFPEYGRVAWGGLPAIQPAPAEMLPMQVSSGVCSVFCPICTR
jgi:hypothetical protein